MSTLIKATLEQLREAREGLQNVRESRGRSAAEFELREVSNGTGGTDVLFTGYACVTGQDYEMEDWLGPWTERVAPGAFQRTLSENPDVNFLVNHEGMALARTKPGTLRLTEDQTGLLTEARLDPTNPQVIALRSAVERGDIDEMSFAFRVMQQQWNGDYDDRTLLELNLHHGDTSAVNYGANPHTAGLVSMRGRSGRESSPEQLLAAFDELAARGAIDDATLLGFDERFEVFRAAGVELAAIPAAEGAARALVEAETESRRRRLAVLVA
jgi:HK97 family phage prohead protease